MQDQTSMRVEAPTAAVMAVLVDFARYPEWIDDVEECVVYAQTENERRVRITVRLWWWQIVSHLIHDVTPTSMSWRLDPDFPSSFLSRNEGRWDVVDDGNRTCTVRYHVAMDARLPIPSHMMRMVRDQALQTATTWVARAVSSAPSSTRIAAPDPWYRRCVPCLVSDAREKK